MTVFENGKLLKDYSFSEVREAAELPLVKQNRDMSQQKSQ